ncbi:MAG: flagellar hook-basal body complex protein, partial [Armatimonadota bacterium]|nr:flagellar hook-basal body complex protein [Armatimonadota bacterium]
IPPRATGNVTFGGNLDAAADVGATWTTTVTVFDSLGNAVQLVVEVEKTGTNEWTWTARYDGTDVGTGTVTFGADGTVAGGGTAALTFDPATGADPLSLTLGFSGLTQYGGASTVSLQHQDGYATGSLESFAIDGNGVITGLYSNGRTQVIGQVALALFANPGGLLKAGSNLYAESSNSGPVAVGEAGTGGRGALTAGALEMSNVDLAQEFTSMITAQRGFQANARVITTSDELLQELISLRR